jgi:XTP/dITP diphosphohydrolase
MGRTLYIASNNRGKQRELQRIFSGYDLRLPSQAGISFSYKEEGESFLANADGKAQALYRLVKQPVLADDSGLCVKSLGGSPGIYSARYGAADPEHPLSDRERNSYLLSQIQNEQHRTACFVCCMVLKLDEYRVFTAQETLQGEIAATPRGTAGFGYDPLFYLPEFACTVAELSAGQKDTVSHRGKAARAIQVILQHLGDQETW